MKIIVGLFLAITIVFYCMTSSTDAYDPLDPNGNITITWDIITWNADGYVASIWIHNFQQYRHIESPGWELGWTWAKNEVIWSTWGGEATEQGDCSSFKGDNLPHNCQKSPTFIDMMPMVPYNQQSKNCCRGGILSSMIQNSANSATSFTMVVGQAGSSIKTIRLPKAFTLQAPGPGYTCGPAQIVKPSKFLSPFERRARQALMTWNVTCTYSQFLAQRTPTCCVALSSFYDNKITNCTTCACGCQSKVEPKICVNSDSPRDLAYLTSLYNLKCSSDMCPIRVHWHLKANYFGYWRAKITVKNFNYGVNYTDWNLVVQHPNFQNLTETVGVNYQPLTPYDPINDTAVLWGKNSDNDVLLGFDASGNIQTELLFKKDKTMFTFENGWAFPRRVYFNGDLCVMPPPDRYPHLPSYSPRSHVIPLVLISWIIHVLFG